MTDGQPAVPPLQEHLTGTSRRRPQIRRKVDPLTIEERLESTKRMASDAIKRLTVGPLGVVGGGLTTVFCIGCFEGFSYLRPKTPVSRPLQRTYFIFRYASSQIIPSLVWGSQPASAIATTIGMDFSNIYRTNALPTNLLLRLSHLKALRGALAGSVLLAQVLSLTGVLQDARSAFSNKIYAGKEPPVEASFGRDGSPDEGVVVRLAGQDSDVTEFSMAKMGRRKIWPVFEDSNSFAVKEMISTYGCCEGADHHATVPLYWQIPNGCYSQPGSWKGLKIPKSWLFRRTTDRPMLILEADGTSGDGSSLSLARRSYDELDFDLLEAAQAFHQISRLVPTLKQKAMGDEVHDARVLRVMLVDCSLPVAKGGGSTSSARDVIKRLRLADVTIDARNIVFVAMKRWLDETYDDIDQAMMMEKGTRSSKPKLRRKRPVVLETHDAYWFKSLKGEFAKAGYKLIEMSEAEKLKTPVPILVYGRTSADTVYTIRALVERGLAQPSQLCALLSGYEGLEDLAALGTHLEVGHVCSSEIYDAAFTFVRKKALSGTPIPEIQAALDAGVYHS